MRIRSICAVPAIIGLALLLSACDGPADNRNIVSSSGVSQQSVKVHVGSDGWTTEQRNVRDRLLEDNKPGATKHLYVVSPMSGQVLIYSTVRGKVTSSGKRLAPLSVAAQGGEAVSTELGGVRVNLGGETYRTGEVIQDDGTYGSSVPYIYWWDTKGIYHQHFFTGGQIIHVSSKPIVVNSVTINLEELQTAPVDEK